MQMHRLQGRLKAEKWETRPIKMELGELQYMLCAFSLWTHKEWILLNIFFIKEVVL